ncbi:MAG TPA: ABC transporter ATP-binding protein [Reyranella sp.]|nr:ABC transporter ATP-binding protein [Reyranella sp.]
MASGESIFLDGVEKTYGGSNGVRAIAPLSVELPAGEAVSVVGPSGCGKSTLLRLIAGLDAPTRGTIRIGQTPVTGPVPDIGIVFQRDLLLEWRSVLGNVLLPAEIKRLSGLEPRASELLQELDVAGFAKSYPWQLSGCMRQRVAIARALLTRPALLFLDEPFSALDALTRDQMNVLLQRLQTTQHVTTLLITHSIPEAIFCADRVLVMSGRPGALLDDIRVPFERPRRLAVRETVEFAAIGRRIREHFEKAGVLVG